MELPSSHEKTANINQIGKQILGNFSPTQCTNPNVEAGGTRLGPGNMRPLQGIKPGQGHRAQLSVRHNTGGDVGRIHGVPGGTGVNENPDVDADDDGNAADVEVDEIEPLEQNNQSLGGRRHEKE